MPLMLIHAPDDVAVAAVRHLSRIQVLAVVANQEPSTSASVSPMPRSWQGLLPQETGQRMLRETQSLRDEWERNT